MKPIIPIFYAVNDYYAPLISVSLVSLIKNAAPNYQYQITILYQELSTENKQKLAQLATDNVNITFESIDKNFQARFGGDQNTLRCDYFT
ncbi:MAG: glycosyltransferase family 8 protein, partial [Candidatus Paralactobacillus gallistercoris]|nr:glycosyltransferase family 8 protein [Candidatus Paralactobacillus gallistercoris]